MDGTVWFTVPAQAVEFERGVSTIKLDEVNVASPFLMVKVTQADGGDEDGDADHDNGDSADHDDATEQKRLCASYWNWRLFGDNKSHRELMVVSCSMRFSSLHIGAQVYI